MQEIILKVRYFERLSKSLKKSNFIFSFEPSLFQQKGPETSDQSLFRLRSKFRKFPLLVMYYLTKLDEVI